MPNHRSPKAYASQGRAVTKEDYITMIQQNQIGLTFDSVSVWSGDEYSPPRFGQVFVSLKPKGSYALTNVQKNDIIKNIIKPISVMTVEPTIVDPDYTYIKINASVVILS